MSESEVSGPIYTSAIQFQINGKTRGKRVDEKKKKAGSQAPETAPELVVKPRRQFVDHGGDAKFKASFDGSKDTKLSWTKDGKPLVTSEDGHYRIYEQDGFHFLEVAMVTMEDHGAYTVIVENSVGSDKASADLDVFEKPQLLSRETEPSWEKPLKDLKAHEDDTLLELVCVSKDLVRPSVQWFHDGKEVVSGSHAKVNHEGQKTSLVIKGVRQSDGGQYKCVISGSNGRLETGCKMTVMPPEKLAPPVFVKELHDMEVEDGDKLELVVEVKGTPPVRVFWFHNNEEITLTNPHFLLASLGNVHTLTLPHASSQCAGQFVCEAYNDCGDTDTFCVIDVKELENPELPHFVMRPCNCTVEEGDDATFVCKMRGQPMPTVVWEREGVEITDSSKHKTSNMKELHSLTIHNVDPLDKGEYTCHLHNTQGNISHVFQLFLMSDIIASSKPVRSDGRDANPTPKFEHFTPKREITPGSQTERFERKDTAERRPKSSHSFMQPKTSSETIVRSSAVRTKVGASLAAPTNDQTQSNDGLQNSPLFKRAKEKFNTKAGRSTENVSGSTSGEEAENNFFGTGTVDFREGNRDLSNRDPERLKGVFTAREASGAKTVVENGLRNLQVERNFRNVLSRGSVDFKLGLNNMASWKNNNSPQGSVTFRDSSFQRSGNKSMSSVGLKAVNKSLGSLGQQNNVVPNSIGSSGGSSLRGIEKSSEPTYSPSSSLQFESNELRKVTSGILSSQNKHTKESIDNAKDVIGDNLFRAEKRPTNMFEPTERPFNTQPSTQTALHHARLTTLKTPQTDSNAASVAKSNALNSSTSSSTKSTNFDKEAIPSIPANTPLQFHVNLTPKISERIGKLDKKDKQIAENATAESRPHSRLKGLSDLKTGNNRIANIRPEATLPTSSSNGKYDSLRGQTESGSVFTWGKRPSKTNDDMIEDARMVSKLDEISKKQMSNVPQTLTKTLEELSVNSSNLSCRSFSTKSDMPSTSLKNGVSSNTAPDFLTIKLKPTQKSDKLDSSSSEQLRKSKFLSKSTENVFGDVKLRPVSNVSARPKSEFSPENVGRLRLKSKSTNFSDINLVSDGEDYEREKEKETFDAIEKPNEIELSVTESKPEKPRSEVLSDNQRNEFFEPKPVLSIPSKVNSGDPVKDVTNAIHCDRNKIKGNVTFDSENKHNTMNGSNPDSSKRTEFMEKIRKWKSSDFTEKLNKIESGSKTARESEVIDQNTNGASTGHRNSIPKSPGTSYLDNVPRWVRQKALNKRNSFQSDKTLLSSNSHSSLAHTYRASLINTGDFSNGLNQNDSSSNLNQTFHSFTKDDGDTSFDKDKKDKESERTSNPSSLTKSDSLKRNEKLIVSSRLGHLRSAPDLKEKSKFVNKNDSPSQVDWLNRKPIKNIEQMIKANSQSKVDKISKEENKPEWARIKSPKDIKQEGHSTLLNNKDTLSSNHYAPSSTNKARANDENTKSIDSQAQQKDHRNVKNNDIINRTEGKNYSEKSHDSNINVMKSNGAHSDESIVSASPPTVRKQNNFEKDHRKEFLEENAMSNNKEERFICDDKSDSLLLGKQQFHASPLNVQRENKNDHTVCKIVPTPPTPDTNDNGANANTESNAKEDIQKVLPHQYSSSPNNRQPLTKATPPKNQPQLQSQPQPQPNDQQPLKVTPVRPTWMKQKSLRHIPIYPINDNELSPRYEPFRKSMDDTSSTNSVSSLASDASGLTTDSGYGKSVLTEDIMNSSKDTLLGRGNLDSVGSEEHNYVADRHNKSSSNDNVFKLASAVADTDSGRRDTYGKKDKTPGHRFDQTLNQNAKSQISNTTKYTDIIESSQTQKGSVVNRYESNYNDNVAELVRDESKERTGTIKGEKISDKMSKFEKQTSDSQNSSDIVSKDNTGANTSRAPKSEFLRKRLSLTPAEDTTKEITTNSKSGEADSHTRTPAIRPNALNISPNTERRNRTNGITSTKDRNQDSVLSTLSNSTKEKQQTESSLQNNSLTSNSGTGYTLDRHPTARQKALSKQDQPGSAEPSGGKRPLDDAPDELAVSSPPSPTIEESCPRFELPLNDVAVTYGSKATLKCRVVGIPIPDIQWLHDRKPIEASSSEIATTASPSSGVCTLTVVETFTDHIGTYSCLASNSAGSVTTSARLTIATFKKSEGLAIEGPVSLPPRVVSLTPKVATLSRDSTLTLTLTFQGEPAPTVTWKQGKKELSHGDGRVSIVTTKGNSVLTINHVTAMDAGKMTAVLTSSIGSDLSTANVCVEDIPGPPVGKPHVYGINRESASLSWCGPSSCGGSTINYYVIEAKTRQQAAWDVLVPQCKELSYHVFGLQPSSTYQFRVRAANKEGLGPPSEPSERVITSDPFSGSLDESDGCPDVFTPTVEYRGPDELPFDPREVHLNKKEKFEDSYDLGPVVGKGKFGIVYKCTQKMDTQGRTWAAKVLKCREKDKAAIRHEVEVMNRLRHPKLLMLWDAFESPRQMILVMEFIGAGELFERVIGEDFVLTERDCVHFLRQICEGVSYMHSMHVLHLDLKPENILCIAENSNRIKIIDFGLARILKPGESTKVLMGTPEFIAPEVINYDEVSFATDMWSIGVICYVLLSGLSPFLGDDDNETLSNVTAGDFDFDDEAFDEISDTAKDFMSKLLIKRKEKRLLTEDCLKHTWLAGDEVDGMRYKRLNTDRLKHFMVRRKWLKTGNAVLAISRLMKTTSLGSFTSRSDSSSSLHDSDVATPRSGPEDNDAPDPPLPSAAVLPQNVNREDKPETDVISYSENEKPRGGAIDDADSIVLHKDQNDNKVPAGEVSTNVVGGGGEKHINGSPPLIGNSPACNSRVSDNGIHSDTLSTDLRKSSQYPDSSTVNTAASNQTATTSASSTCHNSSTPSSSSPPSSSSSSSSTICPSSTSTLPSSSSLSTTQQLPNFLHRMADSKAFVGDNVRFDVTLDGSPFPDVDWYFEEEKLQKGNNSKYSIDTNATKGTCSLIIRSVDEEDDGEYVCKAVNSSGEATCLAELSVLEM